MYNDRSQKFVKVGEIRIKDDRSVVISRYHDGGYRMGVKQVAKDANGGEYSFFLKGAIVMPDREKLLEFAYQLIDIADKA